jgi:cytochrome c
MRHVVVVLAAGLFAAGLAHAQDVASGEKVFLQCKACHQVGETAKNGVGPVLNGLFGRKSGTIEGFSYSPANKNSGITWDEATFREYIKDPKAKIPGTKMVFPGLKDPKQVDDIVAFLKQFDATGKKKTALLPVGRELAAMQ